MFPQGTLIKIKPLVHMRIMLPDLKEIRNRRKALDLTQKDLANLTGLSRSTITKIEIGYLDPGYSKVKKIFEELNQLERQKIAQNIFEGVILEDIHATPVAYASASQSIYDVWIRMCETNFSQFPVKSNGQIVGSISEKLISRTIINKTDDDAGDQLISKVMEEPFPILSSTTPLRLVGSLIMHTHAVLTQKNSEIIGIVTNNDIGKVLELMKK
jgi:predicted transcriptional regulator